MVEIKVTGNTPLEALSSLTAFATHCMGNQDICSAANAILEAEQRLEKKPAAAQAKKQETADPPLAPPPGMTSSGPVDGESGPSVAPSKEAPKGSSAAKPTAGKAPSLENIRAKGIEAAKKYGQAAIKAILKEFDAENMTALPEDKRAEFLMKLEGLGGGNA